MDYASHSAHVEVLRDEIVEVLAGIEPRSSVVPFYSTVTGDRFDTAGLGAEYWFRNLRQTVRFSDVMARFEGDTFVEVSPHPVLMVGVGTLRRGEGDMTRFVTSLAEAHVRGVGVDWAGMFDGARRVDLPTYAFQRQRFWLDAARPNADRVDHPFLDGAVDLADGDGVLLTGHLVPATHPWLDEPLVPGAVFLELAIAAADRAGCERIRELALETPLVVPEHGVQLQVSVGGADESGHRRVAVHSRAGDSWLRHVTGTVAPGADSPAFDLSVWPPAGAEPVPADGVRAMWRRDKETFVEVALPEEQRARFGLHPALLDAAVRAVAEDTPLAWHDIELFASGAAEVRVRLSANGEGVLAVEVADATGLPVASIGSLVVGTLTADQVEAAGARPEMVKRRRVARAESGDRPLRERLAALPEEEQKHTLLRLVRGHVASVLGHESPEAVDPERTFKEIGFDSARAVEVRNRLNTLTGLDLPTTVVFEHPTVVALAENLRARMFSVVERTESPQDEEIKRVLAAIPLSRVRAAGLLDSLLRLANPPDDEESAKPASIDEMDVKSLVMMAMKKADDRS